MEVTKTHSLQFDISYKKWLAKKKENNFREACAERVNQAGRWGTPRNPIQMFSARAHCAPSLLPDQARQWSGVSFVKSLLFEQGWDGSGGRGWRGVRSSLSENMRHDNRKITYDACSHRMNLAHQCTISVSNRPHSGFIIILILHWYQPSEKFTVINFTFHYFERLPKL